jgi:hypothetical protein
MWVLCLGARLLNEMGIFVVVAPLVSLINILVGNFCLLLDLLLIVAGM